MNEQIETYLREMAQYPWIGYCMERQIDRAGRTGWAPVVLGGNLEIEVLAAIKNSDTSRELWSAFVTGDAQADAASYLRHMKRGDVTNTPWYVAETASGSLQVFIADLMVMLGPDQVYPDEFFGDDSDIIIG